MADPGGATDSKEKPWTAAARRRRERQAVRAADGSTAIDLGPGAKQRVAHGLAFSKRDMARKVRMATRSENLRFRELYRADDWGWNLLFICCVLLLFYLIHSRTWPFTGLAQTDRAREAGKEGFEFSGRMESGDR